MNLSEFNSGAKSFIMDIVKDINSGKISNPAQIMARLNDMPKGNNLSYEERQELFKAAISAMDSKQRDRLLEILKFAKGL